MTNGDQTSNILPIHQKLTRDTFAELWHDIEQIKRTITRLADYSAMIGLPDAETTKQLTSAIIDLIAATAEATHKLHHHQARRKEATTANPTGSAKPHQNAPERTNHDNVTDPPSTDNLDKLDHQLRKHND